MAVHYYNLKVISCRDGGNPNITGVITNSVSGRASWNFLFTSTDVTGTAAKTEFLTAMDASIDNAPEHIKLLKKSGTGSLNAALNVSATPTNDGVATSGPWSERVGKDMFRYEIGVSTTSAADAVTKRDAHNLA